jgi:cell wall-associated NlpC family hydrolase
MVAYAAAGVSLVHFVPNQDAVGTQISAAAARPGDLVVFDDEDHVGIYMGNGMVLHAPTEGRDVELDPLSEWSGIAYHYTRLI